jgi:sugar-specific transcriptional regulator TrmB
MNLHSVVKNIGLSDKETNIYLACLELGSSTVSKIAEQGSVNRITTYSILEKLIEKGYVHFLNKNNTKYFDATDPITINRELRRKTEDFRESLPAFKQLRGEARHPKVRYFEGIEGIKQLYAESLSSKTEILNYSNSLEIRRHWKEYEEEYVKERVKRKIFLRGISPSDEHGLQVQQKDIEHFRELRLVPTEQFSFTNEINIYENKVAIASFKDTPLIGMIIESQEVANTQRDIFKMAWEFARST